MDTRLYLQAVEEELRRALAEGDGLAAPMYRMMRYHLGWLDADLEPVEATGGKRLRPLLCLLACQAVGSAWRSALPVAAAIELIHNFSLIHDDIEDDSDTRRHRPTVWKLWGLAQGINTGDAMWSLARLVLYRLSDAGHPAERVLRVSRLLDDTCLALCSGQYLDLAFERQREVSLAAYEHMIAGKTAALIAAATAAGAILAEAAEPTVAALDTYGRELGLAFQIQDDILGVWGDPRLTGKPAADDLLARKKTWPVLHALAWERERGLGALAALYDRPELTSGDLDTAVALLERAGARENARDQARKHQERALQALDSLAAAEAGDASAAREMLRSLLLSLTDRAT